MCVERTASTNVPSARESRASVARQKRAAARGVMFDSKCFIAVLMFRKPKIAQARKQIYPESCGKLDADSFPRGTEIRLRRAQERVLECDPGGDAEH